MNDTVMLHYWGYSNQDIEEAVQFLRDVRTSEIIGPPTAGEVELLTMCEVVNKCQQAGYDARLRREGE